MWFPELYSEASGIEHGQRLNIGLDGSLVRSGPAIFMLLFDCKPAGEGDVSVPEDEKRMLQFTAFFFPVSSLLLAVVVATFAWDGINSQLMFCGCRNRTC